MCNFYTAKSDMFEPLIFDAQNSDGYGLLVLLTDVKAFMWD